MKFFTILILTLATPPMRASDSVPWDYFFPETVKTYGCHLNQGNVSGMKGDNTTYWILEVWAKRDSKDPDWGFSLGYYPSNAKGRSEAMKDCDKWLEEAEKRIVAAHQPAKPPKKKK